MIIQRLSLENWMRIPQLELHFQPGINLVYGPNETGKTSIMRALRYALNADAGSAKTEYKEVVPWGTDVKAKLDMTFTQGVRNADSYRLVKTFPKGKAQFYNGNVLVADEDKKVKEKLYQALDIREEVVELFDLLFIGQGEALQLFDKHNKIAIDNNTRAYIGEVIRSTALQSLQELENHLGKERDKIFTNASMEKLRSGKNASEYSRLLEEERKLSDQLTQVIEKEEKYQENLQEIETLSNSIREKNKKKSKQEQDLVQLKIKESQLAEYEKQQAAFKSEADEYRRLLDMEENIENLSKELPQLFTQAKGMIAGLEKETSDLGIELAKEKKYGEAVRLKKEESEKLKKLEQEYENLEKKQKEINQIEKDIRSNESELPSLFLLLTEQMAGEARKTAQQIAERQQLEKKLAEIETTLKNSPAVQQDTLVLCRKLVQEIESLDNRLTNARSALDVRFKLTPENRQETTFHLKTDDQDWQEHRVTEPLERENFNQLAFRYPGAFAIDVSAAPAQVDIAALKKERDQKKHKLQEQLQNFKAGSIEQLEQMATTYTARLDEQKGLQQKLENISPLAELEEQKAATEAERTTIEQEILQYLGKTLDELGKSTVSIVEEQRSITPRTIRDQLTRAKAAIDLNRGRLEDILEGQEIAVLEKNFQAAKRAYEQGLTGLKQMEPLDKQQVTQDDLDATVKVVNTLENKIEQKNKDKKILQSIPGWQDTAPPGRQETTMNQGEAMRVPISPQELREKIIGKQNRSQDLQKQLQELLKDRQADEVKAAYLEQKDSLAHLEKKVKAMAPLDIPTNEAARSAIQKIEAEIKTLNSDITRDNNRKAELAGEVKNLAGVIEEKNDTTYEREQTVSRIREQQVDIAALKLLLQLIEQEKAGASQHVFQPLEKRVVQRFQELTADRYGVTIDDQLGIDITAKTMTGEIQPDVFSTISFGTKEQLSFLLRLAIAEQLSQNQPQVMILDDAFVNTDTRRLPLILDMIGENAQQVQFLIFTCKEEDYLRYQGHIHAIDLVSQLARK